MSQDMVAGEIPASRWRLHHSIAVSDVDAPPLLMHRAVMPPAQGDQVVELGGTTVRPVDDVMPVNPQMYVERSDG
jgi:hypothetical protein